MLNELELKTFIPAIVAPCVLLYESYTGNHVSESTQAALTNGVLIGIGFAVSLWGAYKNHQKASSKIDVTPPKIPPDTGVNSIEETKQNQPIVTQADLNKRIQG
jgi:hypothetical protein